MNHTDCESNYIEYACFVSSATSASFHFVSPCETLIEALGLAESLNREDYITMSVVVSIVLHVYFYACLSPIYKESAYRCVFCAIAGLLLAGCGSIAGLSGNLWESLEITGEPIRHPVPP